MKKSLLLGLSVAALFLTGVVTNTLAADKEVTIKGEAQCAKCALKKSDKCANAIVAKEDGKEVVYYIAKNEVSDKSLPHKLICQSNKKVEAKGTVKEKDGKRELTLSSIKVAE